MIYCKKGCVLCIATNTRHEFLRILFAPSSKLNTIRARCTSSANHFSQLVHRTLFKRLLLKQVPQLVCERSDKAVSSTYSIHYLHLRTRNSFSLNGSAHSIPYFRSSANERPFPSQCHNHNQPWFHLGHRIHHFSTVTMLTTRYDLALCLVGNQDIHVVQQDLGRGRRRV